MTISSLIFEKGVRLPKLFVVKYFNIGSTDILFLFYNSYRCHRRRGFPFIAFSRFLYDFKSIASEAKVTCLIKPLFYSGDFIFQQLALISCYSYWRYKVIPTKIKHWEGWKLSLMHVYVVDVFITYSCMKTRFCLNIYLALHFLSPDSTYQHFITLLFTFHFKI